MKYWRLFDIRKNKYIHPDKPQFYYLTERGAKSALGSHVGYTNKDCYTIGISTHTAAGKKLYAQRKARRAEVTKKYYRIDEFEG